MRTRLTSLVLVAAPGRYRVVSSHYGNLWLETCPKALVSDVHLAQPASDAGS